jgi:hypothetical protein
VSSTRATEEILENLFDRLTALLIGLGGGKAKATEFYPRPKAAPAQKQPTTIAEFDTDAFMRDLMG